MSFITKRDRVFNEYDLLDLPPRNEGKLKAYASCTDARAWSHFCTDKTEHLVEIIKRNNDICRPKYLSTDVIVQTLMAAKNAEISRLKRKIEEFEQMLAAYDQLELTCEQKCEIANAHAAIKAANKELDELCLDLDLSGFTEGMDSDAFETGKSRGDEPGRFRGDEVETSRGSESVKSRGDEWNFEKEPLRTESKGNQTGLVCPCDVSTSAHDPRIQEMQETIITKDAKLSAMRNTIAVMENDVCEPYCIYAHIYTALEKIFGVLCQNDKYKLYLNLMTAGKDTRCIDIKGKILFKLKVLEKFSQALIAPCSRQGGSSSSLDCACLRAEVVARLNFPSSPSETKPPTLDNKRAQLVADIMANDEMKEILSKESCSDKNDDEQIDDLDNYSIDTENLKRLKNLQENYDELLTCYEKLKYEKDRLQVRCNEYEELEKECEHLKNQLREYNSLWNEKEHYRKRSVDVDSLKEQYLILADETSNLETRLKAESEINLMKTNTIEDLRNANIALEKELNDARIAFEKEKNTLQCKLKETECTCMCQEQQIKSLSGQIDRLIEQGQDKVLSADVPSKSLAIIDEIETLKEQINNLKDSLFCSEEEKQQLLEQFQDKLRTINDLKMEIEDWKNTFKKEVQRLMEENKVLSDDLEEKSVAMENLKGIVDNRSQEIESLIDELDKKEQEKKILSIRYQDLRDLYESNISTSENEKIKALQTLHLARRESQELLDKVKDMVPESGRSSELAGTQDQISHGPSFREQPTDRENSNSILLNEIQKLREVNSYAINNIGTLQEERNEYRTSLELSKKKSDLMENKLKEFERVSQEMESLKLAHDNLMREKDRLEKNLIEKNIELEKALQSIQLSKRERNELISKLDHFQILEGELTKLNEAYDEIIGEKEDLQSKLLRKGEEVENLIQSLNEQSEVLKKALQKIAELDNELSSLKTSNEGLIKEKNDVQKHLDDKDKELKDLMNVMQTKFEENESLQEQVLNLELSQKTANHNIIALQNENALSQTTLDGIRKESAALIDKLKNFESLENEYEKLRLKNESMQEELRQLSAVVKKVQDDNDNLSNENQYLQAINKDIEESLIDARNQLMAKPGSPRLSTDVLREIDNLKKEKIQVENRIKSLINKLDKSDGEIASLEESLLARDDKIATLENYINQLEEEIKKLHENLRKVIETGEEISTNSSEKYDQSIKALEAHHSKAAHNIKMEVAKLYSENMKLEDDLSATKLRTEETSQDKNKYLSQVIHLQNEREIVVNDIKQLEIASVGDSILSPKQCNLDDIQASLDRIRKCIFAKTSKSSSLEQTIQKVQTSSQILLTKADEAKKIVEKEKQKITMEKEEAIREKINMENKLAELKQKLENQISRDQEAIKELEADIQNQQLMAQNSISKLKSELQNLQSEHQNSLLEIKALQEKLRCLADENKKYLKETELQKKETDLLNADLKQKSEKISELQKEIEKSKNKTTHNISVQAEKPVQMNVSSQTDSYLLSTYEEDISTAKPDINRESKKVKKNMQSIPQANILQSNKPTQINPVSNLLPNQTPNSVNEVQILTANVEPNFDFDRSSYLNQKMQQLSPGKIEQYSISDEQSLEQTSSQKQPNLDNNNSRFIDIYNRSVDGATSKAAGPSNDSIDTESSDGRKRKYQSDNEQLRLQDNDDNEQLRLQDNDDLLFLYKEPVTKDTLHDTKKSKTTYPSQMAAKVVPEQRNLKDTKHKELKKLKLSSKDETYEQIEDDDENEDDDSVKPKLKINLPRVNTNSPSVIATSEGDKKSEDSDILNIYSSYKRRSLTDTKTISDAGMTIIKQESPSLPTLSNEDDNLDPYNALGMSSGANRNDRYQEDKRIDHIRNHISELKNREKNLSDDDLELIRRTNNLRIENNESDVSHHDLSRVNADPHLLKPKETTKYPYSHDDHSPKPTSFALDYILNTVRQEVDPESIKISNLVRESPRSRSDERLYLLRPGGFYDSVPSKYNPYKASSHEYKTTTSPSQCGSKIVPSKSVAEQSVMAKDDDVKYYEDKIRYLTNSLEITEKDYKRKLAAIKTQYDSNIKNIINEHNQGVKNIQGLHEETLQDIIKIHENEIENLRSMSIEANRKAEKLERENRSLRSSKQADDNSTTGLDEEPVKMSPESKKRRKSRFDSKMLTKTNIVACNVKPKTKSYGPCTCSLDVNISDTIKNIFEQANIEQRKMAEQTYIKYIANKILGANVEALDAQELAYLHLKVCRTWKMKVSKEEALQKRIDNLESELINRQRHAQQHIAELDRKVEEEKRRLQEVREAVCRGTPDTSRNASPDSTGRFVPIAPLPTLDKEIGCACNTGVCGVEINERRSAGDLAHVITGNNVRQKRTRMESNRAVSAKIGAEERKDRRLYHDEPPTRLRRSHDRQMSRGHKK